VHDADIVVIGAGPNGLFAACRLARAGLKVLVVEANERPGGALWSLPTTGPGTVHDVGAGFIAFADSVAFRGLDLEARGLEWLRGELETTHPAIDGTVAAVSSTPERCDLGHPDDTRAFLALQRWHAGAESGILPFLGPIGRIGPLFSLGVLRGLKLASMFVRSPAGLARSLFRGPAAQRVMPGMGMHVDLGPDDPLGAAVGYMLTLRSTTGGFLVPRGGARRISELLVEDLEAHGGRLRLGARVEGIDVREGRACGVVL
jgi:phytoene dehydrogenase-like protein